VADIGDPAASTAAALLAAWETGAVEAPVDQAPSLLRTLELLAPGVSVEQLAVGDCDASLYRLRRELFGDLVEAVAICAQCGEEVELEVSISELEQGLTAPEAPPPALELDGYTISYRLPLNEDLSALAARGAQDDAAGVAELIRRCVVSVRGPDGAAVPPGSLRTDVGGALADAMAASDPGASVELAVTCPCGHAWVDELDIRLILWTDLTDWVGRTLTEVHHLAGSYGWSEAEILTLPAWRRRWYLEAVGL